MSPGGRKTDLNATSQETVSRAAFHCVPVCVCARARAAGLGDMSENDQKQSLNFRCSETNSGGIIHQISPRAFKMKVTVRRKTRFKEEEG